MMDNKYTMSDFEEKKAYLRKVIQTDVIISNEEADIPILYKTGKELAWFCDFRRAFSDKAFLTYAAEFVWEQFDSNAGYQIGGLESAALPFITATVLKSENATGFFIRKSRKKKGQTRLIEGKMTDKPVILVDDLIGRGGTFEKQIKTLEEEGFTVVAVFAIIRFKPIEEYEYLVKKKIPIHSIFTLDEFTLPQVAKEGKETSYQIDWYFGPKHPHKLVQGPRCLPAFDDIHLYTGSDNGKLWKVRLEDGSVEESVTLLSHTDLSKSTFTNVVLGEKHAVVGTWTGSFVTVEKNGLHVVGSVSVTDTFTSPLTLSGHTVLAATKSSNRSQVHTMLCFDVRTQRTLWETPISGETKQILLAPDSKYAYCATESGHIYKLDIETGAVVWSTKCTASFVCSGVISDKTATTILFPSYDGSLCYINAETGAVEEQLPFEHFIVGTPVIDGHYLYTTSLEREAHCFDIEKKSLLWKRTLDGRSSAAPLLHQDTLYVGDNSGTLHALNAKTGALRGSHIITERINNGVLEKGGHLFVTTALNEVYCFSEHPYSE